MLLSTFIAKLKSTKVKAEVKKEREEIKYPKLMDPESVRANAKKALYQILWKRYISVVYHNEPV